MTVAAGARTPDRIEPDSGPGDLRVTFSSSPEQGTIDGAWWPRSTSLVDELPKLIGALPAAAGWIVRGAMAGEQWPGERPTWIPLTGRHPMRLGWFTHMPAHTLSLTNRLGDRMTLMVVWPDTASPVATAALDMAATPTHIRPADFLDGAR